MPTKKEIMDEAILTTDAPKTPDKIKVNRAVTVKVVETVKNKPRVLEGARIVLSPEFDFSKGTTALKTGVERDEWKEHYEKLFGDYDKFYADFQVVLTAKTRVFDESEPRNQLVIALLNNHSWVARNSTEITQASLFVLFDEEEEASKENKAFEYELKAYKYLAEMSQVEKADFLKLYGFRKTEMVSPEIVMKRLKDKAIEDAKGFTEMWEDKNRTLKIMIEDFLTHGIVKRIGGVTMFGDAKEGITMGSTTEQVVEFLRGPKNTELIAQMMKMLDAKKSIMF